MKLSATSARPLLRAYSTVSKHYIDMINSALKPEVVLSESNRKACIRKFRSMQFPKLHDKDVTEAAILIPLCSYKGEVGLLYTLRSIKLRSNAGQASFPGGMRDKTDVDLQETALRETWEELKIPKDKIDVWTMGNFISKTNVNVMPVLAYVGEVVPEQLEINHDEVDEAFVISLQKLCDPELCHFTYFHNINLTLPNYLGGKHRVWGFTGAITHFVLECLVPDVYRNKTSNVQSLRKSEHGETETKRTSQQDATRSKI
ncbi:nucleoside diphosphate-linked moiety X motif 8 isoform X1 [Camponotus floridanus]|nr:nucleoside diphosphate-linked moiety X motif 8 isoform X1 [Camponotus floridanus]